MNTTLKLAVHDIKDLTVLSSLLQDATVLVGDMGYDADDHQFLMVAARFFYEDDQKRRRLIGVNFSDITSVKRHGIDLSRKEDVLSLLSITFSGMSVDLTFSGDAMLKLETQQIKAFAADLDEGWVTHFEPAHPKEDSD
jgi:hypothetical protein